MKYTHMRYLIPLFFLGANSNAQEPFEESSVMDFNYDVSWAHEADSSYRFVPAGDVSCGSGQTTMDKLCNDNNRFFLYYSGAGVKGSDSTRYGAMMIDEENGYEGSALKITFTGGYALDEDGNETLFGLPITNYADYEMNQRYNSDAFFDSQPLIGQPMVYLKPRVNSQPSLGVFNNVNRFTAQVWYPASEDRQSRESKINRDKHSANAPMKTIAWYPFIDDPKGSHYYHHTTNRAYGTWIKVQFDAHPTHSNSGYYNDLHSFEEGGITTPGNGVDYFERIAAFAFRFHEVRGKGSPYSVLTDDWKAFYAPNENEETISNLGMGYDPESYAFDISLEDKYRCKYCSGKYEVRYSFSKITNENYDNAKKVLRTENWFIEDDNDGNYIIKPNNYYNQVWAKLFLPVSDAIRYESGERIYFAVKDLTERTFETSWRDNKEVILENGEKVRQRDLVKTIYMEHRDYQQQYQILLPTDIYVDVKEDVVIPFESKGLSSNQPVVIDADDALRAQFTETETGRVIKMSPTKSGEFTMIVRAKDFYGNLISIKYVTIHVNGETCETNENCNDYTIVSFTSGKPEVKHNQWAEAFSDRYTGFNQAGFGIIIGNNGTYNYQGASGEGFNVTDKDVVYFAVKNVSDEPHQVSPYISSESQTRRSGDEDPLWTRLRLKTVEPGGVETWFVPAMSLTDDLLSSVNVSIPNDTQGLVVQSIGFRTENSFECDSCGMLLVDFYDGGEDVHTTTVRGWDNVIQDIYTGNVGSGSGIIIGRNPGYNYQGVVGNVDLRSYSPKAYVYWQNNSDTPIAFTPKYSGNDPDRIASGQEGDWYSQGELIIPPGETVVHEVDLPSGEVFVFNSNANYRNNKELSLNKIALTEPKN